MLPKMSQIQKRTLKSALQPQLGLSLKSQYCIFLIPLFFIIHFTLGNFTPFVGYLSYLNKTMQLKRFGVFKGPSKH